MTINDNCDIISDFIFRTAEHSSVLIYLCGGRHQLQHREVATWEQSQLYQSQAVMWAMFDKGKTYTLHI